MTPNQLKTLAALDARIVDAKASLGAVDARRNEMTAAEWLRAHDAANRAVRLYTEAREALASGNAPEFKMCRATLKECGLPILPHKRGG